MKKRPERHKKSLTSRHAVLQKSRQREANLSALLEGTRAVLEYHEFKESAQSIFNSCRNLTGATAGYIALLSKDGTENEVLFLDAGDLPCAVDPSLPMPIRGFREKAYLTGKTVWHNDFARSDYVQFMPEGHVPLSNVLFAPLMIKGKAVGVLGLSNKPGGFTENDARLSSAFGELAAIALYNSRTLEALEESENRFRSVVETASDAIISVDDSGKVVFWNKTAEMMLGYSADEMMGQPVSLIMPERFYDAHQLAMNRVISTGETKILGRTIELVGRKKDGSEFPLELSTSMWSTREGPFFTAILRDITRRKEVYETLQRARDELEVRVEERTAELKRVNEELRIEMSERKRAEEAIGESEKRLRFLSTQLLAAQENERKRIALEIHDGLGQIMSAVKFSMERKLEETDLKAPASGISLEEILLMLQGGIEEARRIMNNLRPSILDDLGISPTINWFCREFQKVYSHITIQQQVTVRDEEVPGPLKIVMFRVLQEAMNNAAKHSGADRLTVSLSKGDGKIHLAIADNGRGFDLERLFPREGPTGGLGLSSMRERTELSGGSFHLVSAKERGTTIRASWPISL